MATLVRCLAAISVAHDARGLPNLLKVRAQTGHASDATLGRYVREGELFIGNAAGSLL